MKYDELCDYDQNSDVNSEAVTGHWFNLQRRKRLPKCKVFSLTGNSGLPLLRKN
jgi:hypothetical protein